MAYDHDVQRCLMVFHDVSWCFMVFDDDDDDDDDTTKQCWGYGWIWRCLSMFAYVDDRDIS